MIINPFDVSKKNIIKEKNSTVDIDEVIKYISTNYSKYLFTKNKDFFEGKIKEYICLKYCVDKSYNYKDIISSVLNKIFGYGVLQKYIDNKSVSDIRVVRYNLVYIKINGAWKIVDEKFNNKEEFRDYIKYCIVKNNGVINYDNPIVIVSDKEYKLRIEAGISPINYIDDNLIIRIHRFSNYNLNDLYKKKMLDEKSLKELRYIINNRYSTIIAGKGGSGKTTLLRTILTTFPDIIPMTVCEETSELFIENKNIIQREIGMNKINNRIDLKTLLKHSLVMSNDIIVVGELKGEETSVFFDAINTGHIGFSTVHADSIFTVIDRLVLLCKRDIKAQKYDEEFIKKILYSCINCIIFMKDYKIEEIGNIEYDLKKNKYFIRSIYKRYPR